MYIAAASLAHISLYSASAAAIPGVVCPSELSALSLASEARLSATAAGGTVVANAVS